MAMAMAVKVAVRARPLLPREVKQQSKVIVSMKDQITRIQDPKGRAAVGGSGPIVQETKEFAYDYSYWSVDPNDDHYISQERVFNDLGKTLLESAVSGYNACALAYGQTGSGKTYTMMGTKEEPGLVPRLIEALFEYISDHQTSTVSFRTEVSFMEIYNEHVGDLLQTGSSSKKTLHNLRVREHPVTGPYVQDLSWHLVSDCESMLNKMNQGNQVRATAATLMNDMSSRSHAIFTIKFTHACFSADKPSETVSRINLVDLAGSERAKATGATGSRLKEGSQINKSLVSLGNVISALADQSTMSPAKQKKAFVPYRDSVLTYLLKDSLGGNSQTIMVAAISPAHQNFGETLSTLRYASRAKDIINKPVVNEDPNVRLIRELRAEIARLKALLEANPQLMEQQMANGKDSAMAQQLQKNERLAEQLVQQWTGKWEETKQLAEGREVAVKGEGASVTLDAEVPHLVAISDDLLSTGITLYYIQHGKTTLGSPDPDGVKQFDIDLVSYTGDPLEGLILNEDGKVTLQPLQGKIFLNGLPLTGVAELHQGQIILFGQGNLFRFNHPVEAEQLRQELKERGIQPSSGYSTPASLIYSPVLNAQRQHTQQLEFSNRSPDSSRISFDYTPPDGGDASADLRAVAERLGGSGGSEVGIGEQASSREKKLSRSLPVLHISEPPTSDTEDKLTSSVTPTGTMGGETELQEEDAASAEKPHPSDLQVEPNNARSHGSVNHHDLNVLQRRHQEELEEAKLEWKKEKARLLQEIERMQSGGFPLSPKKPATAEFGIRAKIADRRSRSSSDTAVPKQNELMLTSQEASKESTPDGSKETSSFLSKLNPRRTSTTNRPHSVAVQGGLLSKLSKKDPPPPGTKDVDVNATEKLAKFRRRSLPPELYARHLQHRSSIDTIEDVFVDVGTPQAEGKILVQEMPPLRRMTTIHSTSCDDPSDAIWDQLHMMGHRQSVEVDSLLDSMNPVPSRFQLQQLAELQRRQQQQMSAALSELSKRPSGSGWMQHWTVLQQSQQRQLARLFDLQQQLKQQFSQQDPEWAETSRQQIDRLSNDRYVLETQLKELQEKLQQHQTELETVSAPTHVVSSFTLSIAIPEVILQGRGGKACHYYLVKMGIGPLEWTVERSYPMFLTLHISIQQNIPAMADIAFPPMRWFGNKRKQFVQERRQALEAYMQALLVHMSSCKEHNSWQLADSEVDLQRRIMSSVPFFDPAEKI